MSRQRKPYGKRSHLSLYLHTPERTFVKRHACRLHVHKYIHNVYTLITSDPFPQHNIIDGNSNTEMHHRKIMNTRHTRAPRAHCLPRAHVFTHYVLYILGVHNFTHNIQTNTTWKSFLDDAFARCDHIHYSAIVMTTAQIQYSMHAMQDFFLQKHLDLLSYGYYLCHG